MQLHHAVLLRFLIMHNLFLFYFLVVGEQEFNRHLYGRPLAGRTASVW